MKTTLKRILFVILIMFAQYAEAQNRSNAVGLRLGGLSSGINFKHTLNNQNAIEVITTFGYRSSIVTGLYQVQRPIPSTEGLRWMYGGGAHVGMFAHRGAYWLYRDKGKRVYVIETGSNTFIPGVDFLIGMEYKFSQAPFTIGVDFKPFVDFYEQGFNGYFDGALNFRFVF